MSTTATPALTSAEKAAATRAAKAEKLAAKQAALAAAQAEAFARFEANCHRCPEPGCWIFPFGTAAELAEHVASGAHSFPTEVIVPVAETEAETPAFGNGTGRKATATVEHARWAKVGEEWVVKTATGKTGETVQVHKASGEIVEVVLGETVKAGFFRPAPKVAPVVEGAAPTFRWTKAGSDWLAIGPATGFAEGDVITIVKANGDAVEATITGRFGTRDGAPLWRVRQGAKPKATTAPAIELEHGRVYATADGTFVKVQFAKGSGKAYGKVWDGGEWAYSGARILGDITRNLTAEEAAAWGHEHSRCVFCSTKLADDGQGRSVEVGYGPTCAEKYGLPWG